MSNKNRRPMFPHVLDSTIMSTFRSCPQKAFRQYVEHWKPKDKSVHLVAGGAFASGVEAAREAFYLHQESREESVLKGMAALIQGYGTFECPSDSPKSLERMLGALEYYFHVYPLGADGAIPIKMPNGKLGIEFSFTEPLPIHHPVTGDPLLFTGRADMIAEFAGGVYIFDEKTTSSLGARFANQWEMRSQFTAYSWAAGKVGINAAGTIVRGISILKTKYDTLQIPTYRSKHEIERWEEQTCRDIDRMIRAWKEGHWDYNLDGACVDYNRQCEFTKVCKSSSPETWFETDFSQRVWVPQERKEMTVEEYEKYWEVGGEVG